MKKFLLSIFVLVFTAFGLFAQVTTSSISGTVSDAKGALPGVTIVATHIPSGTVYSTATRADGRFNLPNLRIGGPYSIKFNFVGYKEYSEDNITLSLDQDSKINVKLVESNIQLQEVRVSGQQDKVLNSSRTGTQETITRTQIERLPSVGRSIYDYTKLTPTSNGTSFGGRNNQFNSLTVDGALFNNSFGLSSTLGGQTNSQPISLDAIEQIQVNIAPFDVTQGRFAGTGINTVTKSGTNQFKGTVYGFYRDKNLVGLKAGNSMLASKPSIDYNQRGISLGGPIIKNKLFLFVSGEQERINDPATTFTALRSGQTVGGTISAAPLDSLVKLQNFLKTKFGYDAGAFENYQLRTQSDKVTAKLDWNLNKKNTLSAKYFYLKSFRDVPASSSGSPTGGRAPSANVLPFFSSYYTINNDFNIGIVELNSRISDKYSNKLTVGYTALRDKRSSPGGGLFPGVDIQSGSVTSNTFTSFGYEPFTANNLLTTDTYQFSDNFTIYKGKHEFVIGTSNELNKYVNGFAPNYNGLYRFKSMADFINSANNGTPTATQYQFQYSALPDGSFPFAKPKVYQFGFYAQDKWQATDKLKLTYGLRADAPVFKVESQRNTNVEALSFRDGEKIDVNQFPKTRIQLSPRAGFNWNAGDEAQTQVRGGLGVFMGPPPYVMISNQASNNGVQFGSYTLTSTAVSGGTISPSDPRFIFNPNVDKNRPAPGTASANTSYAINYTDPDLRFPKLFRVNAGVDRKLPGGIVGTVEFLYGRDINALNFKNQAVPSAGTPLVGPDNRIRYTANTLFPTIAASAGGNTAAKPNIAQAIEMTNTKKGYNWNISVQLQKTTKNFYFSAAYVRAEAKSVNDGGSTASGIWTGRVVSGDPNADVLSYASYHQPHRVFAAVSYRKEYAKYFGTSIGLTFEAAPINTFSYTYSGDLNNDAQSSNDLIYIPRDASEILLVPDAATDLRTPAQIYAQLDAYINQDRYLSRHRGSYAERNGGILPDFKQVNLNFTQDFFIDVKGKRNTLQLSANMINFGNFLNRDWGNFKFVNRTALLSYKSLYTNTANPSDPNIGKPQFSFPYYTGTAALTPLTSTFGNGTGSGSRWQAQVGLRYIFN